MRSTSLPVQLPDVGRRPVRQAHRELALQKALAVLALASAPALAAERPRIAAVQSSDLAAYSSVVAGFAAEVRAQIEDVTLSVGDGPQEPAAEVFRRLAARPPAMVLAIGPAAAAGARQALPDVPIVFCMVPYHERYDLEGPNVTGIALTGGPSIQLATLKALLPAARRVGILHDPRYSAKLVQEARSAAEPQGLSVVPLEADGLSGAERALKAARGKVDAMLMVGDKTVASAAIVRRLIDFGFEAKVPFVALSSSQVKEGALLSLSPSYTGIGQQAGRLAQRIVFEKVNPGALEVAQPEVLELAMNLTTAKRLGAPCDIGLAAFKLAAERGHAIRVFE